MNSIREEDLRVIISKVPYKMCEGATFLITGAGGFLASYLVDTLMYLNRFYLEQKCNVLALCRGKSKAEEAFGEYLSDENFKLFLQSVEEPFIYEKEIDYIIHAASGAVTSMFKTRPADILRANIIGTDNMLMLAKNKRAKGVLFFSSGAIYGNIPEDTKYVEESNFFPLNHMDVGSCYAEGKRAGEALCNAYYVQHGVPAKSVRIGHTYGPGINLTDERVFSEFVNHICKREDLVIRGSGNDVRSFCYISDAVVAFFKILFGGCGGEAYNMVNNCENWSISELAEKLTKEAFPERGLHVKYLVPHSEKAVHKVMIKTDKTMALGWRPEVDVITGFQRTVKSFEEKMG